MCNESRLVTEFRLRIILNLRPKELVSKKEVIFSYVRSAIPKTRGQKDRIKTDTRKRLCSNSLLETFPIIKFITDFPPRKKETPKKIRKLIYGDVRSVYPRLADRKEGRNSCSYGIDLGAVHFLDKTLHSCCSAVENGFCSCYCSVQSERQIHGEEEEEEGASAAQRIVKSPLGTAGGPAQIPAALVSLVRPI